MEHKEKLSECEEMLMSILLDSNEDLVLTEIMEKAKNRFQKEWKMQTVCTFLTRMEKKGYISSYRIGRYSHYRLEINLEEFRKQRLQQVKEMLLFSNTADMADFMRNMGG